MSSEQKDMLEQSKPCVGEPYIGELLHAKTTNGSTEFGIITGVVKQNHPNIHIQYDWMTSEEKGKDPDIIYVVHWYHAEKNPYYYRKLTLDVYRHAHSND